MISATKYTWGKHKNKEGMIKIITMKKLILSASMTGFLSIIGNLLGLNIWLFAFIIIGLVVEFILGIMLALKQGKKIESRKLGNVLVKIMMILFLFFMVTAIGNGLMEVANNNELEGFAKQISTVGGMVHLFVSILVSLYIAQSILENWASLGNPLARKLAKLLKVQIKKVENLADNFDLTPKEKDYGQGN